MLPGGASYTAFGSAATMLRETFFLPFPFTKKTRQHVKMRTKTFCSVPLFERTGWVVTCSEVISRANNICLEITCCLQRSEPFFCPKEFPAQQNRMCAKNNGFEFLQLLHACQLMNQISLLYFQYIRSLREQIVDSRDTHDIPIFIVGNKHDLSDDRDIHVPRREVRHSFLYPTPDGKDIQ